jgi:hypothetical protein|nr:hypothetical protein [Dyella sp. ASV24]
MEELTVFFSMLVGSAPLFIASIAGIALSAVLWAKAPKAAMLMLIACGLQLLLTLANAVMYGWYVPHATQDGGYASIRVLTTVWSICASLLHATAFALLFWSAFTGRQQASAANR